MTRVIGLDVSSVCTGVARVDGSTCSIKLKSGTDPNERMHKLGLELTRILRADEPDVAMIEEPAVVRGRTAARRLHEFVGWVRYLCWLNNVRVIEVGPSQLKAWVTNNGRATKEEMVAEAVRRGASPANDDEADAYLLRAVAVSFYDNPERADAAVAAWLTNRRSA